MTVIRNIKHIVLLILILIAADTASAFDNTNILVEQAVNHMYRQRYREAHASLKAAYEQSPRHPGVHCNLGRLFELTGNFNEAYREYSIAAKLDTSMVTARRGMARCSVAIKRQQAAVIEAQNAALRQSSAISAPIVIQHPAAQSRIAYNQAPNNVKNNPVYNYTNELKLPTLPAKVVRQVSKRTEEDKAESLIAAGKTKEAKKLLDKILTNNPDSPKGHFLLGKILSTSGELFPAISHLEETIKVDENYYDAYYLLGRNYAKVNLLEDALKNYTVYYNARPQANVAMEIGKVYETLGNTNMANTYYAKANTMNPGNSNIQMRVNETAGNMAHDLYLQANYSFSVNKFKDAYELFSKAIDSGSLSPAAQKDAEKKMEISRFRLAEISYKTAEARQGLEQLMRNYSSGSLKFYQLSDVSLKKSFADGITVEWIGYIAKKFTHRGRDVLLMVKELDRDELEYMRYPENNYKLNKHYNNPGLFLLEAQKGGFPKFAKAGTMIAFNAKTKWNTYEILNEMGSTVELHVMEYLTGVPIPAKSNRSYF